MAIGAVRGTGASCAMAGGFSYGRSWYPDKYLGTLCRPWMVSQSLDAQQTGCRPDKE